MKSIFLVLSLFVAQFAFTQTDSTHSKCIYIPNNVSMHCDQSSNDFILKIISSSECKIQKLMAFNRWGSELFSTQKPPFEWNASKEQIGTYFVIVYYLDAENKEQKATQSVTVIR